MSLPQHQADVEHNANGVNEHNKGRGMFGVHVPHVPVGIPKKPEKPPMSLQVKNHVVAMIGEYVGTVLFLMFAFGGTNVALAPQTALTSGTTSGDESSIQTGNTSNLLYISLAFGFSLTVSAWIFFRVSGGLFNPAVSLGMALVGVLTPLRACLLVVVQILGGMTAAGIVQALTPGPLNVRTTLSPGTSVSRGLFIEMFLTTWLMLAILFLAAEKHKATFIAPVGIGIALFMAEMWGVYYTGGSLNPARSFGPSVADHKFNGYDWIYWVGPALGATLASGFYLLLKWFEYETVLGPETDQPQKPSGQPGAPAGQGTAQARPAQYAGLEQTGLGSIQDAPVDQSQDARLDRIESMLMRMSSNPSNGLTRAPRESMSTVVGEGSPKQPINHMPPASPTSPTQPTPL
jgi:MIP family channel proteins